MPFLKTTEEFEAELDELVKTAPDVVGLIDALIDELAADQELLSTLHLEVPKWHYGFTPPFEIKRFGECWKGGRSIYSLKPYDEEGHLIPYRVFIAHDIQTDEYFALTVQPRASCYDTSHPAYRHLCERYDRLNIPAAGRFA